MSKKRWCLLVAALLVLLLAALIALVVWVDPFEIYHRALFYQPAYASDTQMYANAGIAKSYEYDSIIIGSSVTENCRPSVYEAALGGRFVKLCMNAGLARDHAKMMEIAFRTHEVTRVVYGLDLFSYSQYYTNQKAVTPDYLYDDCLLNDVSYWFNSTVLLRYIPESLARIGTRPDDSARDTMYFWDPPSLPGAEALRALVDTASALPAMQRADLFDSFTRQNYEQNLLPFIAAHRETTFTIFFPPYSLLYWAQLAREGTFEAHLAQKDLLISLLLCEPNVEVYDFQTQHDWVCNDDLYFDLIHYVSSVNDGMAQAMAEGRGRILTSSQAQQNHEALAEAVYALFP